MKEHSLLFRILRFVRCPRLGLSTWWSRYQADRQFCKIEVAVIKALAQRAEFANCQHRTIKALASLWVAAYRARLCLSVDSNFDSAREAMQNATPTARKLADLVIQTVARDGSNVSTLYHVPIILPTFEELARGRAV